jgi:hypothetical protein
MNISITEPEYEPRDLILVSALQWQREAGGWRLFHGHRRFGRVVPDAWHPGMWRVLP